MNSTLITLHTDYKNARWLSDSSPADKVPLSAKVAKSLRSNLTLDHMNSLNSIGIKQGENSTEEFLKQFCSNT